MIIKMGRIWIVVGFFAVVGFSGAVAIAAFHRPPGSWTPGVSAQPGDMNVRAARRSQRTMPMMVAASDNLLVIKPLGADPQIPAIRAAIEETLDGPPLEGYSPLPAGVRLLSVKKQKNAIALDFSGELLSNGTGAALEDSLHQILGQIGNLPGLSRSSGSDPDLKYIEFQILVNGVKLEYYLEN